jgi:peptide/nickel transport system permease protein
VGDDPSCQLLGQEHTVQDVERLREAWALNDSFRCNMPGFLGRAVTGGFGIGYRQSRPVAEIIAERCAPRRWNWRS